MSMNKKQKINGLMVLMFKA